MMDSTREEAETLREINTSVTQIEGMTQQNAAMVEETSASSRQLAEEADQLVALLNQFRIDRQSASHGIAA